MVRRRPKRSQPLKIVILTGGTGQTGAQVVQSALAQFEDPNVEIVLKPRVRTPNAALKVIESVQAQRAILCHTLVQPEVREAVTRECHLRDVQAVDLLGPTVSLLDDHLDSTPRNQPGLSSELNKEQLERIDAVDFTLVHDDGARVGDLKQADVVLVGVSRVSKSVTCFYLAARGVRAANVPLTMVHPLPPELERLDPQRVIGLTMNAARLSAIRQARLDRISKRPVHGYAEQGDVVAELRHVASIITRHGWRRIDVSYKATEEVASEIIEMLPKRKRRRRAQSRVRSHA
jgi:regulator of PEP synthase PpsR (kinase-PPPase family)